MGGADAMLVFVVREAISRVAAPDVAKRIEGAALQRAGLQAFPVDPLSLRSFIDGALSDVITDYLGDDEAEGVRQDLAPILAQAEASSGVVRPVPAGPDAADASETEPDTRALDVHAMSFDWDRGDKDAVGASSDQHGNLQEADLSFDFDFADDGEGALIEGEPGAHGTDAETQRAETAAKITSPPKSAATAFGMSAEQDKSAEPTPERANVYRSGSRDRPVRRILVADDDAFVLEALARALRAEGFEVVTAADGYAALELCQSALPDVVVADLHMPAISGRQLINTLQRTLGAKAPPVIIVTGNVFAPNNVEGCVDLMRKPVDIDKLTKAIELAAWDHVAGI